MTRAWTHLLALVVMTLPATAPARVPKAEQSHAQLDSLSGRYSRIALMPVRNLGMLSRPVEDHPFNELLGAKLAGAGFEIAHPESVSKRWDAALRDVGGIFDPRTGRLIPERRQAVWRRFATLLEDSLGSEVVLRYEIVKAKAMWEGSVIRWDDLQWKIGRAPLLATLVFGQYEGPISAASLAFAMLDLDGRSLYQGRTGVAPLLERIPEGWIETSWESSLADEKSMREAVDRALGPWIEKVRPAAAQP